MMRCIYLLFSLVFSLQVQSFTWRDLWSTRDQQGQSLMSQGQFEQAKDKFERRDWAAAAAYKSGDLKKAAEYYQEVQTESGYYNQGNVLARLRHYEKAITAYDKALALNPRDQDAIDNRKLVEDLLKKDKEKQQGKNQQNKDQQNKDQQNKDQQNKDQQNKDQQNKDQQNKDQQNKDQQNKDQQNKDQQNKDQQNKDQQNKDQQNKDQQNKDQQNKDQQNKDQQNKEQQESQGKQSEKKAQSQADREKQQAKEQWLRLIPDNPGGLMRQKFLRDHLRREHRWYQ